MVKHVLFSSLPGEDFHLDYYFSKRLKPPTRLCLLFQKSSIFQRYPSERIFHLISESMSEEKWSSKQHFCRVYSRCSFFRECKYIHPNFWSFGIVKPALSDPLQRSPLSDGGWNGQPTVPPQKWPAFWTHWFPFIRSVFQPCFWGVKLQAVYPAAVVGSPSRVLNHGHVGPMMAVVRQRTERLISIHRWGGAIRTRVELDRWLWSTSWVVDFCLPWGLVYLILRITLEYDLIHWIYGSWYILPTWMFDFLYATW